MHPSGLSGNPSESTNQIRYARSSKNLTTVVHSRSGRLFAIQNALPGGAAQHPHNHAQPHLACAARVSISSLEAHQPKRRQCILLASVALAVSEFTQKLWLQFCEVGRSMCVRRGWCVRVLLGSLSSDPCPFERSASVRVAIPRHEIPTTSTTYKILTRQLSR